MTVSMLAATAATLLLVPLIVWVIVWDIGNVTRRAARRRFVLAWRAERELSERADFLVRTRPVPARMEKFAREAQILTMRREAKNAMSR